MLRTLCREIARITSTEQAQLFVVDYLRTQLGVVADEYVAGYAISALARPGPCTNRCSHSCATPAAWAC